MTLIISHQDSCGLLIYNIVSSLPFLIYLTELNPIPCDSHSVFSQDIEEVRMTKALGPSVSQSTKALTSSGHTLTESIGSILQYQNRFQDSITGKLSSYLINYETLCSQKYSYLGHPPTQTARHHSLVKGNPHVGSSVLKQLKTQRNCSFSSLLMIG